MFDKIDIKDRKEKFQSLEKEAKQVTIIKSPFWLNLLFCFILIFILSLTDKKVDD